MANKMPLKVWNWYSAKFLIALQIKVRSVFIPVLLLKTYYVRDPD